MAAPKGNEFYKRREKDGRELIYSTPDKLLEEAYNYFDWCKSNPFHKREVLKGGIRAGEIVEVDIDRPYTIEGLCVYAGISVQTFFNYEQRNDFFEVVTHIREVIRQNQLEGAIVEAYSPNIVARLLGLSDKKEITGQDGKELVINITPRTKEEVDKAKDTRDNLQALKDKLQSE
ncbi:MAG: terminase small subunit [Dysgonomonas sp.]